VALLKFPDVLKEWTVALNQKEDILVGVDQIKKDIFVFLTKLLRFLVRVRECINKTELELNEIFLLVDLN
jgi:hypothetical protein